MSLELPVDPAPATAPVDALAGMLERLVVDLGLARAAVFTPGGTPPPEGGPQDALVAVRAPGGQTEGWLRCRIEGRGGTDSIRAVADLAGAALEASRQMHEIARREDALRRVAERLQDSLLPPLPTPPNTLLDVRYRAAGREARVGGDFYDVFPLPGGKVLVVVGDVVGKGVEAAVRTSRITQTFRALALQGFGLDVLLERVDEQVVFQDPDMLATAWCGLYEPQTGEISFASLGHPPALLVRYDGNAIWLETEGLPLGMRDLATDPTEVRSRQLEPRDLLVIYTDGVIEASGDVIAGQAALLDAFERHRDEPLGGLVDGILDELLRNAGHADDAVMLLLRRR